MRCVEIVCHRDIPMVVCDCRTWRCKQVIDQYESKRTFNFMKSTSIPRRSRGRRVVCPHTFLLLGKSGQPNPIDKPEGYPIALRSPLRTRLQK